MSNFKFPMSNFRLVRAPSALDIGHLAFYLACFERLSQKPGEALTLAEGYDRLLPGGCPPGAPASAPQLPLDDERVDARHAAVSQRLHGLLDVHLGGVVGNLERELAHSLQEGALFRQQWTDDDLCRVFHDP